MWFKVLKYLVTTALLVPLLLVLYIATFVGLTIYFPNFGVPPIARDISSRKGINPEEVFSERVLVAFPVGMHEDKAIEILDEQGFTIYRNARTAEYSKSYIGCEARWSIKWQVDDANRLSSTKASYGGVCM